MTHSAAGPSRRRPTRICRLAGPLLAAVIAAPALGDELDPPPVTIPRLAAEAASVEAFAPQGWRVEAKVAGDLDGDGRDDAAFVLRQTDPKNILKNEGLGPDALDTNPRILAVAVAARDGYRLAVQNATLIPRHVDATMDDLFSAEDLEVVEGAVKVGLHLFMSAGGWGMANVGFTFRLKEGALELIGYDRDDTQRNSGETASVSVNYPAGKMSRGKGSISVDEEKTVWSKAPSKRGPAIGEIGDGLDFDPAAARTRR